MKTYAELKKINVNEHTEKKGNLTYLSWAWAVDQLLTNDPTATWVFGIPVEYNETMMVSCKVYAFGKTMEMQLPVMDNRNNAVRQPDSRRISDAQMRCLTKCIACFGIGLYIYAGEDIPSDDEPSKPVHTPRPQPVIPPIKMSPAKIAGKHGEFQIVIDPPPEGEKADWLELVRNSSYMLLDLCSSDADVMTIFKKNKVLFDTVKAADPVFFANMMVKFTEVNNSFKKD
jgi:hypothetical protein